jgi:hypothetical protein
MKIKDILYRLSIIFLAPTLILVCISMPIKWILTGELKYKYKQIPWLFAWVVKVFAGSDKKILQDAINKFTIKS